MLRVLTLLICLSALAGCGVRTDLKPRVGAHLPVPPYGRTTPVGSAELLLPKPQARPAVNVELRIKSEVRADDPFDLPPQ